METKRMSLLPRERLLVGVTRHVEYELRCAKEYGLGVEIQIFSLPDVLESDFKPLLDRLAARTKQVRGPIGCHGAFFDTCHFSVDPEVRKVARKRYIQSIEIAHRLGARFVVFHSQYNPIVRVPEYPEVFHARSLAFWQNLLEEARRRRMAIYVENMFDDSPKPLRRLLDAVDAPDFKACLDVAHAAIFSEVPFARWVSTLKPHLRHVHLNDCNGRLDDHLGLGQGTLDIAESLDLLKSTRRRLTYTLETGRYTLSSLRYLGLNKL